LATARQRARDLQELVRLGRDPLDERAAEEQAADEAAAQRTVASMTFREVAKLYVAAHEPAWRNSKHRQQWANTLETYVYPRIGDLVVSKVDTGAVTTVIEPIWRTVPETASRIRGRIEAVLDYAKARGWREGENPARWRGHLKKLLPERSKIQRVEHHAALPYSDIGAFMQKLAGMKGSAARALEFLILTSTRTTEVRCARPEEIDFKEKVWTIPAGRIKAEKMHRVPLCDRAIEIAREALKAGSEFVFAGGKRGKPLSENAMLSLLERMGHDDITVHGFRSTFRDWAAEQTNFAREIAEVALAHDVGDETERAYQRGDLLRKRRLLMEAWARYCATPRAASNVTALNRAGA
jgi:integrase